MNIRVTLKYGLNRSLQTEIENGMTVADLVGDATIRDALALPESVGASINGVAVDLNTTLRAGDVVTFERRAAQKAA